MFVPLLLSVFLLSSPLPPASSLNQEGLHLRTLKQTLDDPDGFLTNTWSSSDDTPCRWRGVTCNNLDTVIKLDLSDANLAGPFPATALCRLRNLSYISFYNNNLNYTLPGPELAPCSSLSHLDLSQNLLTGHIPGELSSLPELTYLDLSGNNFSGEVPASFRNFAKLQVISLVDNLLDGEFPNFLSGVPTLRELNLSYNPFKPTPLAAELMSELVGLEKIWLTGCNLVGEIPNTLGRLRNLTNLDLAANRLSGSVPASLTQLASIVQIELYDNDLSGEFPVTGWANLSRLRYLDASMNRMTGTIPDELAGLPLASLNLYQNRLEGELPGGLARSPNLYELKVFGNRLSGELPGNLGSKSPLVLLDVSNNSFTGPIPASLCSKGKLEELLMIENSFTGEIPGSLGECRSLLRVRLGNNQLSGEVPESVWGLPRMSLLELVNNSLSGVIAKTVASASNLSVVAISKNRLTGEIPAEVGFLSQLVSFSGGENQLSGSLPSSIVNLGRLSQLSLHDNQLSGEIPVGEGWWWRKLNELNLANNRLSGEIPREMGSLSALNYLDLSGNELSGRVPAELQNLKLNVLNLSNNRLLGPLPPLFADGMYESSFLGNPGLSRKRGGGGEIVNREREMLIVSIFVIAGAVLVVGVWWFLWRYNRWWWRRRNGKMDSKSSKWTLMSFHKLGFSEQEIMECLEEDNVIGSGGSGKVYKAVLSNGESVAVKRLWSKSSTSSKGEMMQDGFEAEVETLGRIRHKNIVRLWCCCATRDCKLLVYEYMPNGSLGDLLHSSKGGVLLEWGTRFKIAVDAAEGLSYLHHDCVPPIVHRDVKSNNILLDAELGARVADFGVAKVVETIGKGAAAAESMSVIAGSCGYIAPEYGYTLRVNEKSDTYSFGVVILELVTGKRPVDPEYGEKDLVKWVCTTLEQKGIEHIIDPKLDLCFKDEIIKVLNIGLMCTSPLPINRPSMRRVVKMLQEVNNIKSTSSCGKRDGKLSPYYYEDAASDHAPSVDCSVE